jgi:hypothetical protein
LAWQVSVIPRYPIPFIMSLPIRLSEPTSRYLTLRILLAFLWAGGLLTSPAQAQALLAQNTIPKNTLDSHLVLATPAELTTGLSAGVGVDFSRRITAGGGLAWGARASWSTATEYTRIDTVRNDDIRLRLYGLVQHHAGRGSFGLRLGAGATAVYEGRTRAQGARLGLTGSALETTAWYLLPAADLEVVVVLRVWKSWGMSLSGGPAVHLVDGSIHAGWSSGLGVSWQP